MAICGFCKKEITIVGIKSFHKRTPMTIVVEEEGQFYEMYSCPYCESVLGFSKAGF
ncbi:MAG: hypothetical protein ACFFAH_04420 [Promethearchaeota archaeon]